MPSSSDSDADTTSGDQYVTTFDPANGDRASEAVVLAVATLSGKEPVELSPLYEVVEPDALDSLCAHADRIEPDTVHRLWFPYEGYDVCVQSDGEITVLDPSTETHVGSP